MHKSNADIKVCGSRAVARTHLLLSRNVVTTYDFPSRDGIAGAVGSKFLSSESICVIILVRVRTRPLYFHSYYWFVRNKFRPINSHSMSLSTTHSRHKIARHARITSMIYTFSIASLFEKCVRILKLPLAQL